jgi:hypothetical protein
VRSGSPRKPQANRNTTGLTGGSRKGKPNKITRDIKEMVVGALAAAGGQNYLQEQSGKNPAAFMALVGKVLPLQITGTGPGEAIVIQWAAGEKSEE